MDTASLIIEPDGTVIGLYSELIPLTAIGRLSTRRATRVEFDATAQQWCVSEADGRRILYRHVSRQRCLEWERNHFSRSAQLRRLKTPNVSTG